MTYAELLRNIGKRDGFDPVYSISHLTVDECFKSELAENKSWNDKADAESLEEVKQNGR